MPDCFLAIALLLPPPLLTKEECSDDQKGEEQESVTWLWPSVIGSGDHHFAEVNQKRFRPSMAMIGLRPGMTAVGIRAPTMGKSARCSKGKDGRNQNTKPELHSDSSSG